MTQEGESVNHLPSRAAAGSAILLSFIVALEIVIMISPFAFFFYAVFNPFLLALNQSSLTRWLTAFFLPHMIVPPNTALMVIRILGSVLFVGGALLFLVCATQVYLGKLLKKGVTTRGLYRIVRHPQYLGLGLAGLGLVIMWPRFLNLMLFALMLFLYYLLAKDEERRMIRRFGEGYISYMDNTGMFFPNFTGKAQRENAGPQQSLGMGKAVAILLVLLVAIVGSGFVLRGYVVRHLPMLQIDRVDVIAITEDDLMFAERLLPSVLEDAVATSKIRSIPNDPNHRILAYFIPVDYVMQGMIANTGERWKLFEQHKTIQMIADYTFHPQAHRVGEHGHHPPMHHPGPGMEPGSAMKRRIIFIELSENGQGLKSPYDDFGINVKRTPLFFVDLNLHTQEILRVQETPGGSGWGSVPTPMF